ATSTDVERVFSMGHLLLSHVWNWLSAQSMRALMCLGVWSKLGYVLDNDVLAVAANKKDVDEEGDLEDDWDAIVQ
ncbi:hypothetical protein BD779DRAFT_1452095, partial [Infundibulicybe gibba]